VITETDYIIASTKIDGSADSTNITMNLGFVANNFYVRMAQSSLWSGAQYFGEASSTWPVILEYSINNSTWTTAVSYTNVISTSTMTTQLISGSARYIRLRATNPGYSRIVLTEFAPSNI
jgi:hypothetical protein